MGGACSMAQPSVRRVTVKALQVSPTSKRKAVQSDWTVQTLMLQTLQVVGSVSAGSGWCTGSKD